MPLFDTHTHIYLSEKKSQTEIISDIQADQNLKYISTIGIDIPTSKDNILLAQKYDFIIPTIGIHPCHVEEYKDSIEETMNELERMIQNSPEVKAIGECGLDYYRLPPRLERTELSKEDLILLQKRFFKMQISLAKKYQLPIIIHNREAREDVLHILKETECTDFVFHCYSEDIVFARKVLDFAPESFMSFSGILTFNNAKNIQETAANIPIKNILIETDCPYLSPQPERGTENYPSKVKYVLQKLQSLRNESPEEVEEIIYKNSLAFFKM